MANMFNVEIVVISTLGEGGRVIITPEYSTPIVHWFLVISPKNMGVTMLFQKEMDIGLLKTLTLLILIGRTVNPILILETIILMCLISNANLSPISSLILTTNATRISKTVVVPDIQLDSTNEQESDGSKIILEKRVGNSLLDQLPVEILEKYFWLR